MAPMMADVQAIVARCGDDEKCIERETMKLGASMSGTAQLNADLKMGKETAAVMRPGADRYQRWQARSQRRATHSTRPGTWCMPTRSA